MWLELPVTYRKLDVAGCSNGNASYYGLIPDMARKSDVVFSDQVRKYPDIFFVKKATAIYFAFLCVIYVTGFFF